MQEKCDTMVMSSDYLILDALPEKIWLPVDGKRTWYWPIIVSVKLFPFYDSEFWITMGAKTPVVSQWCFFMLYYFVKWKSLIHYHSCHACDHYKSCPFVFTPKLVITHCFTTLQLLTQRHTSEGNVKLGFSSKRVNNYIFPFAERNAIKNTTIEQWLNYFRNKQALEIVSILMAKKKSAF